MDLRKYKILKEALCGVKEMASLKEDSEDAISNDICCWLKAHTLSGELNAVWMRVPNERVTSAKKDVIRLFKQKANGLIPGAPDYVILAPGKTIFIEVKTKAGRQSAEQRNFEDWVSMTQSDNYTFEYHIVNSWEALRDILATSSMLEDCE